MPNPPKPASAQTTDADPRSRARALFLTETNTYGCAEATLVALQEHYGLPDAGDSSAAMALNGGIAYSGSVCGAITGAAMAVGRLAERRIPSHAEAKRAARQLVAELMADFTARYGSVDCRSLIGFDFTRPGEHEAFMESGIWRDACMRHIENTVGAMGRLADRKVWDEELHRLGVADGESGATGQGDEEGTGKA